MSNLTLKQIILIIVGTIIFGIVGTFVMLWVLNALHDAGILYPSSIISRMNYSIEAVI